MGNEDITPDDECIEKYSIDRLVDYLLTRKYVNGEYVIYPEDFEKMKKECRWVYE